MSCLQNIYQSLVKQYLSLDEIDSFILFTEFIWLTIVEWKKYGNNDERHN